MTASSYTGRIGGVFLAAFATDALAGVTERQSLKPPMPLGCACPTLPPLTHGFHPLLHFISLQNITCKTSEHKESFVLCFANFQIKSKILSLLVGKPRFQEAAEIAS